eukprot:365490-Chlamydomonas_euryale.AAC.16
MSPRAFRLIVPVYDRFAEGRNCSRQQRKAEGYIAIRHRCCHACDDHHNKSYGETLLLRDCSPSSKSTSLPNACSTRL